MRNTIIVENFIDGQKFAKALFQRIPKPELSRSDTSTYLRRLERLNTSCLDQLRFYIHYPDVKDQLENVDVGKYVYNGETNEYGILNEKGEFQMIDDDDTISDRTKDTIQQKRCDAILIASKGPCRATKNINKKHTELLFVLALNSEIAISFVNAFFLAEKEIKENTTFFAEVPKSWDGFFASAGFDGTKKPEFFGTTIPAHSFLRTWMLDDIENYQPVQEIFETGAGMDVKYPDDPDIKLSPQKELPTVLIASDTNYSEKKPELEKQFFEDATRLSNFAASLKGTISIENAETARKVLVRMFSGAQTLNTSAVWTTMVRVEQMYSDFGIVANPSTQTTFNDILERNSDSEMYSKLHMLREFVTHFPKFAPQWLKKERQLQTNVMKKNPKELTKSNEFVIANLTQQEDFEFVQINSKEDLERVHKRMHALREWWTKTFTTLTNSAKTLEKEKSTSGLDARTETPIIVFRAKATAIIQTGVAVEGQFRVLLNNLTKRDLQPSTRQKVKEWLLESQTSSDNLNAMTISESPDVALPTSDIATQFARNLVSEETKTTEKDDAEVVFKIAEPLETTKYDGLLKQVQENLKVLAEAEKKSKEEILTKIEVLTKRTGGIMDEIQTKFSNRDWSTVPAKFQTQIKNTLFMCQGAKNILTSVLTDLEQKKIEDKKNGNIPEDVFRDIHNILVEQESTLTNYYNALQLLERNVISDREINESKYNETTLNTINDHIRKANDALHEARTELKQMKQNFYVTNSTFEEKAIQEMVTTISMMMKLQQDFSTKVQSETTELGEKIREETVKRSEELLKTVVRTLLNMEQNITQQTEQFKLISAIHGNKESLAEAKEKAKQSARIAKKHLETLKIQESAQEYILNHALTAQSAKKKVTASYETLDEMEKRRVLQLQIEFKRLIAQLETHLNEPRTLPTTLQSDLSALHTFTTVNKERLDVLKNDADYETQYTNMENVIHIARQRLLEHDNENKSRIFARKNNKPLLN